MMFYDPSTNEWTGEASDTTVHVTDEAYSALMGKLIEPGPGGQPQRTSAQARADLKAAATATRWAVETGGITLPNGVEVHTAKDDQDRITSTIAGMAAVGIASIDFKAASGWTTLTLEDLRAVRAAIALHVQACFSAERAHHEAIDALADAELDAYDVAQGWPA